jgi:hypothetical protein
MGLIRKRSRLPDDHPNFQVALKKSVDDPIISSYINCADNHEGAQSCSGCGFGGSINWICEELRIQTSLSLLKCSYSRNGCSSNWKGQRRAEILL